MKTQQPPLGPVKKSNLAGSWYPSDQKTLEKMLGDYLAKAQPFDFGGKMVKGLVIPHAGYQYSGLGAAHAYKTLAGRTVKRVVILAPAHYGAFAGFSTPDYSAYETPLGNVPVDREAVEMLWKDRLHSMSPNAHSMEHAIEIQLPFLQVVLKDFKVVPVLIGDIEGEKDVFRLAEVMARLDGPDTIFIASSDFTHYGERFGYLPFKFKKEPGRADIEEALKRLDMGAAEPILKIDHTGFLDYTARTGITICGRYPIAILLKMFESKKDMTASLLKYYTSIEPTGDWSSSVSYASIAFTEDAKETTLGKREEAQMAPKEEYALTKEEKETLLKLAKDTLDSYLGKGQYPDEKGYKITENLQAKRGVFVTLTKKGNLRGCIGYIEGIKSVYKAVMENAVNAALEDPRFPHVTKEELPTLDIEISVMTPLTPVADVKEIEIGKHGLVISKGWNKGLLLPQVATEWNMDRTQFLEAVSNKAMLPSNAWKDKDAKLLKFSAIVFGEEKRK